VDVEAAVFGGVDEAWGDKEAEGDGDDQVDGFAVGVGHLLIVNIRDNEDEELSTYIPARECVSHVDREIEFFCKCLEGNYGRVKIRT
jgi:hypothetical protein